MTDMYVHRKLEELHDKVDKLTRIVQGYDDNTVAGVYKIAHDKCPQLVKNIMKIIDDDQVSNAQTKLAIIHELLVDMPRGF